MSKVKVAKKGDIEKGKVKGVKVSGEEVALYHTDSDEWFATSDLCTHENCSMSHDGGKLQGYEAECDCHGSKFDIRTGAVTLPPAVEPLKSFKVEITGGDIVVEE